VKFSDILIIVFTYGRLDHTEVTLEELSKNKNFKDFNVLIFSDGPKPNHIEKVNEVRKYLKEYKLEHNNVKVIEREKNIGLEKSIIDGITEGFKSYKAVIAIEDDIRTSLMFLEYMKDMLSIYEDSKSIGCISGFNHPSDRMKIPKEYRYDIYFAPRTCSWGWATWKDRWENVDWKISDINEFVRNGKKQREFNKGGNDLSRMLINQVQKGIDTWDIQWCYHNFKHNRLTIYPIISYVENIGMDGTGIHCGKTSGFKNDFLNMNKVVKFPERIEIDKNILKNFKKASSLTLKMFIELAYYRVLEIVKSIFKK